ncbi:unnamed protein product [Symbiodinium microadriaticum]|nr:unnamed protein product [Symbiodinium microadriaticum]CAE7946809.1 unnamed protein product [Symbiodinium sp. KB8]
MSFWSLLEDPYARLGLAGPYATSRAPWDVFLAWLDSTYALDAFLDWLRPTHGWDAPESLVEDWLPLWSLLEDWLDRRGLAGQYARLWDALLEPLRGLVGPHARLGMSFWSFFEDSLRIGVPCARDTCGS